MLWSECYVLELDEIDSWPRFEPQKFKIVNQGKVFNNVIMKISNPSKREVEVTKKSGLFAIRECVGLNLQNLGGQLWVMTNKFPRVGIAQSYLVYTQKEYDS